MSIHVIACQIERIIYPTSFRKTPWAKFQLPNGYFLVDVWFEDGQPKMQIRSNIEHYGNPLEIAATVSQAIHMAIDWVIEVTGEGRNTPPVLTGSREDA